MIVCRPGNTVEATALLGLDFRKILPLGLPETHAEFLQLLSQASLDVRANGRFFSSRTTARRTDLLENPLGSPEAVGNVACHVFDPVLHVVEIFSKDGSDPGRVERSKILHLCSDALQNRFDLIYIADPSRFVLLLRFVEVCHLNTIAAAFSFLHKHQGTAIVVRSASAGRQSMALLRTPVYRRFSQAFYCRTAQCVSSFQGRCSSIKIRVRQISARHDLL
mmetsp:Transcript_2111/g.4580  ORF Transcript_2111/g.4580 Transcript_2111/m.4580 type:complete len:221 (+) Transcript_2111:2042-2704(+)